MKLRTLVVIPAYNEELNIKKTIYDLMENAPNVDYVVVNDGSTDNTLGLLKVNKFHYIDSYCNLGLFGAMQTGFKFALKNNYDVVLQFDGDGQHSAKYIQAMIKEIQCGYDIVIGSRYVSKRKPLTARMLGSRLISLAIRIMTGEKLTDPTSGLRAYSRRCISDYALGMNNPPEPDTLVYMIRKGMKVKEVQVEMNIREFGESYLNISNTIKYMSRMLISVFLIQPFRKRR